MRSHILEGKDIISSFHRFAGFKLDKSKCPFCKREFSDILKHLVFTHDIRDINHFAEEFEKTEKEEKKKIEFRNYVEDLKSKMREGTISAKAYRELVTKWMKDNR